VSCARCQLHRGKVPDEAALADIQRQLTAAVDAGDLSREAGPAVRLAGDPQPLFTEYYQCRHCEAVWRLTAPRQHGHASNGAGERTSAGMLIEMMRAGSASGTPIVREPISMFETSVILPSPDGRYTASVTDAQEFQTGAPTHGTLTISNGIVREHCSPSMVWSDDSEYLATSEIGDRSQPARVVVFSMSRGDARYAPGQYDGLEFQSFSDGTVRATDGEKAVEIDVSALVWDPPAPEPSSVEVAAAAVPAVAPEPPAETAEPIAPPAPAPRERPVTATPIPRGWRIVNDELHLSAAPPSLDGVLTAASVLGVMLLFWTFIFLANRAGLGIQSPLLLGPLAVASLLAVGWLVLLRGPWRVVFDRGAGTVRATRWHRVAGPVRFSAALVSLRAVRARPHALVTLRIGTLDLILATQPTADAAALHESIVAWMTRAGD
jgi:hypothetical protein